MRTRVSPELARQKLSERRERLKAFLRLEAPQVFIDAERRLIANAIYELETGWTKEEPKEASAEG